MIHAILDSDAVFLLDLKNLIGKNGPIFKFPKIAPRIGKSTSSITSKAPPAGRPSANLHHYSGHLTLNGALFAQQCEIIFMLGQTGEKIRP